MLNFLDEFSLNYASDVWLNLTRPRASQQALRRKPYDSSCITLLWSLNLSRLTFAVLNFKFPTSPYITFSTDLVLLVSHDLLKPRAALSFMPPSLLISLFL